MTFLSKLLGTIRSKSTLFALLSAIALQAQIQVSGPSAATSVTANTASPVAPELTITSSADITDFTVSIIDSYSVNDQLSYPSGTLPSGVTVIPWSMTTRSIVFKGTKSAADWQSFLRTIAITTGDACSPETRKVSFAAGESYYNPLNGHFYRLTATQTSWTNSQNTASGISYYGKKGYLVTLTSAAENTYVSRLVGENSWMGASDDYLQINDALGYNAFPNQSAAEGKFFWVTGPEKGTQLTTNNGNGNTIPSVYQNWRNGEPNNSGTEHYGHVYSASGDWNDFADTQTIYGIMEFGDMPGDETVSASQFSKDIFIEGSSSGSISGGNVTVCSGTNSTVLTLSGLTGTVIRWESSTNNFITPGTQISNNTSTLTVSNITQTTFYRAVVNSTAPSNCNGLVTSSASLLVENANAGNVLANNTTICAGANVELFLTGQEGDVQKWQRSTDNAIWSDIANTATTLEEPVATVGNHYYRAFVQISGCGSAVVSDAKEITVVSGTAPVGGAVSSETEIRTTNNGTLTLTGHTGTIAKWQQSTDNGIIWSNIVNTGTTYAYSNIATKTLFRAQLMNGSCGSAYSAEGSVNILDQPAISNFTSIIAGNGETITITGTGFTGTTAVSFGATAAFDFTIISDTEITATVGTGSSGAITVTNPAGSDSEAGFIYKVAQYNFENDPLDATANNYDGTEINTVSYETGAQGQAICFDNGPGYVKLPDNMIRSLSEFTISLRFRTTGTGSILGYQNIAANSGSPTEWIPILLITSNGKLKGTLWTGPSGAIQAISANAVNDGNWHQVDFVGDTNAVSIYLDGNLEASQSGASVVHLSMDYNQLGLSYTQAYNAPANTTWEYFDGCIDDLVIMDRALTALEIEEVTALPEPTIDSFTPTDAGEQDVVVITGTNFDGATQVTFGGEDALSYTVDSSIQITAVIDNGASGTIEVTTAGGTAIASGFIFTSKTVITTSQASLNPIIYCGGQVSSAVDFEVSATDIFQDMVITAPTGFEVSLSENTGFGASVTITPSSNAIAGTNIYLHVASAQNGTSLGNVSMAAGTVSEIVAVTAETNNSLYFDGVNDYVELAGNSLQDGTTAFTIEAWILPDNSNYDGSYHAIFGRQSNGSPNLRNPSFYIIDGKIHVDSYEDNTNVRFDILTDEALIAQNVWSHIALVKQGTVFTVYVNGVAEFTTPAPNALHMAGPYQIGFIDNYFAGKIDDVRFWNVSRTATEIANNIDTTLTGNETGLVGYYNFNEGIADGTNTGLTTLTDRSPSSNDGTLFNMSQTGSTSNWVQGYFPQVSGNKSVAVSGQIQLAHLESGGVWTSSDTGVATVDQSGLVTGVAIGSVGLQYTLCGQTTIKILQVENPLPTITSFTPDFMGALGEVVITGTNFYNISDIMFGGTDADSFVVDSNTKITAIVGSGGTSGDVTITNSAGTATQSGFVFNRPPSAMVLSNTTVAENQTSGTEVGTLTTTDANTTETFTYELVAGTGDDDNNSFTIVGDKVNTAASFDFENKASYLIRIRVTDSGGLAFEQEFSITINNVDEDADSDGINDSIDLCPNTPNGESVDIDGCSDTQQDSDNDTINDAIDNCVSVSNTDQLNTDGDAFGNVCDDDDDDDGTLDTDDAFPLDENEDTDTDGDGMGDNIDTDDDGDGTPDSEDAFPKDSNEDTDTDGDGMGDNTDNDSDNDGTPDNQDAFPKNPNEYLDSDGDGTGDNTDMDDDNDGIEDVDTDGDGTGDNVDDDDDNDGISDSEDTFPTDANEDTDTDGDGIGDNTDDDDDNDGYLDIIEDEQGTDTKDSNSNPQDTDKDVIPDAMDDDDDNDGVADNLDDFPIEKEPMLRPAEAFTPNGDGNNDTWMIPGIDNYPNAKVVVYNRWGHEVFAAINYRNNWSGDHGSGSKRLPPGSYLYIIDLGNGNTPLRGWLFLNY